MRNPLRGLIAALLLAALPLVSNAAVFVGVSVGIAPPALPVYVQPPCPAPGYIWIPGYWAWEEAYGYYWVPGTWALAPVVGYLWTPGYWGWESGLYLWHPGYWGPHVGFYGGINYGFGYFGRGYEGGYWRGNRFYYNRAVTNINTTNITNVYNRTVVNNVTVTRVSFNGGSGGVAARPTSAELAVEHERHVGITPVQRQHAQMARSDTSLRAAVNGGRPAIAATARPAVFSGQGVVAAHGASPALRARADREPAASMNRGPAGVLNRNDRPPQAQRPALVDHGVGPRADRPPQSQRPGAAGPGVAARADRPQPQRASIPERRVPESPPRSMAGYSPARPSYPQPRGAAVPGGASAVHPGAAREVQGAARQGGQHPPAEREERERGH